MRLMLLGGIAGPVLFAAVTIICAALTPGYDHVNQFISELGATGAPYATLMNFAGFMAAASLIFLFALATVPAMGRSAATLGGACLIAVFAVNMFAAGIWSCDTGCPTTAGSPEQQLHDMVSVIAFPALILAALVLSVHFLRRPGWRGFGYYTLATGTAAIALLIAMVASEQTRTATGLLQRLFLFDLFLWLGVLSIQLRADTRRRGRAVA